MKLMRDGLQRFNICIVLYFVYVCFFYERGLFNGIFYEISKLLIWLFLIVFIYESIMGGYQQKLSYVVFMSIVLFAFYYIDNFVSSSTVIGFGLYEFIRTMFILPLAHLSWLNLGSLIIIELVSYSLGIAIYYAKKQYLVIKSRNDVINELKPTK